MVSADGNAARLILHLLESGQWRDEVPRLVRGALGRRRGGHWDLTVANAWATLAVEKFSRAFEATPVAGASTATLAGTARRIDWTAGAEGRAGHVPVAGAPRRRGGGARRDGPPVGHGRVARRGAATRPAVERLPDRRGRSTLVEGARPAEPRAPGQWRRGDLVRVTLEVEAQADMTWVVVDDPIPAGASHVGSGLARDSAIARAGERQAGRAWPAFQERGFEGFRAYYEYAAEGDIHALVHAAAEPGRPLPAPDHPGRGALRARGVRRASQRRDRGAAVSRRQAVLAGGGIAALVAGGVALWLFVLAAPGPVPSFAQVRSRHRPSDLRLLDRHGEVIHEHRTDPQRRRLRWTRLDEVSPALRAAVLEAEDRRFLRHAGVDTYAVAAAVLERLTGRGARGASTVTMQLAAFLDPGLRHRGEARTLVQKWRQMRLALAIEKGWTKDGDPGGLPQPGDVPRRAGWDPRGGEPALRQGAARHHRGRGRGARRAPARAQRAAGRGGPSRRRAGRPPRLSPRRLRAGLGGGDRHGSGAGTGAPRGARAARGGAPGAGLGARRALRRGRRVHPRRGGPAGGGRGAQAPPHRRARARRQGRRGAGGRQRQRRRARLRAAAIPSAAARGT